MDVDTCYHPTPDQIDLADLFGEALVAILPIARLHADPADPGDIFDRLGEIGLFGIARAEGDGGSGLGVVEECLIATTLGRQLVAPSIIATLGAQTMPGFREAMRVSAAYVEDGQIIAVDAQGADGLLVRGEQLVQLLPVEELTFQPAEPDLWLSRLDRAEGGTADPNASDANALLRLRLLDAAVLAGIAGRALDMAVAYAQMREQFGRPIGSFQAVKHSCADMAIAARTARDQVGFAAVALNAGRADAPLQVESALLVAIDAAMDNAGRNIQIHGGIGFSDEADPHLVLKRARIFASIAGGTEQALLRIAALPAAR